MVKTHTLKKSLPDGSISFLSYAVNGDEVEVSCYRDSDLVWAVDMTREEARSDYRQALTDGWTK